jgi:hypothetical protein
MVDTQRNPSDEERRNQYFDGFEKMVDRHRDRGFDFEKEAIEYSKNAFTAPTYLNGGGLLAMPTAVALFHADLEKITPTLIYSAGLFILGLLCVVGAQSCAFFTMARRSEAEQFYSSEQKLLLDATIYPDRVDVAQTRTLAIGERAKAVGLVEKSNMYRGIGLVRFLGLACAFCCRLHCRIGGYFIEKSAGVNPAGLSIVTLALGTGRRPEIIRPSDFPQRSCPGSLVPRNSPWCPR